MLQAASDWYWGVDSTANADAEKKDANNDNDENDENAENPEIDDAKTDSKEEEEFHIEIEKELESVNCKDPILLMFKLIDFDKGINTVLTAQFGDQLTKTETDGLLDLFNSIYKIAIPTKGHLAAYSKMMIGEVILSYFASISPTNPDAFGCWDRWLQYRLNEDIHSKLNTVDSNVCCPVVMM